MTKYLPGKYVYCISELPSAEGIELGKIGLFDDTVRFISYKGIGAFVGDLKSVKIVPNIETITGHQRVVEASRKICTTLPVKFGVIFSSDNGVREMLAKDYQKYKSKISNLRGKDEFGVKVMEVRTPATETKSTKPRSVYNPGAGTDYLMSLKREETQRMDRLMNKEKKKEIIDKELSEFCERTINLGTDVPQMMLNNAYLVKRSDQQAFISKVDTIREELGREGLLVHVSGPWAPYSFC